MDVQTLTVKGCLRWDVNKDGLKLRAGYILIDDDGYFEVGTAAEPMNKQATIFLKQGARHPAWGTRFLWGQGNSRVEIHGRVLSRSWTLLARTAAAGATRLHLKHNAQSMGWRVGDLVGLATTSRSPSRPYTITAVHAGGTVEVQPPLAYEHMGGMRRISLAGAGGDFDRSFELAAEVVNLQRSVVITGEPNWDTPSREGLHTGMHSSGYMDIRYARVENCGQPPNLGRYCLHFHHMHQCPRCTFQGNAVVNGTQVGITIHGTHRALVDRNVLWNTASVGVYIEDGNEMNNTISDNAIICMHRVPPDAINPNKPAEHCQRDLFNEPGRLGGIFAIGMTNHILGNRIVNMENGMWFKGSADPQGRGRARGRICPEYLPFGTIRGNVCHDNRRFGIYPDNQLPRKVQRDANGMLPKKSDGSTDWSSCEELTADGRDNGVQPANIIEDELDYHNMFVGQYSMGDVEYRRYVGINNGHCMYWKSSKNFADGKSYHMRDSICITDWSDPVFKSRPEVGPSGHVFGPAGGFTFRLKNVTFAGDPGGMGALSAGQHCMDAGAGGPCNVQYLLEAVDFSAIPSGRRHLNFGAHSKPPGEVLPVFLAKDGSLGGFRSVVSGHLNGFEPEGCVPLGAEYDGGLGCSFPVRRFNVWTKDLGPLRISGPGYRVAANPDSPTLEQNAGHLQYANNYNGYGALVIPGKVYTLETNFTSGIHVDFSEWFLPKVFGALDESIRLTTAHGECIVRAMDASGQHYGRFGPQASSSQGECTTALGGGLPAPTPAPKTPSPTPPPPSPTPAPPLGSSPPASCRTAAPEDECYKHVTWAMQHGIKVHPDVYDGLTAESSFEDFQSFLYEENHGDCPMPCPACHTAVEGEECYGHVAWARTHGIRQHPAVYDGLTEASSFEDFQAFLHRADHGNCPLPCPADTCHTAVPGEECYGHVSWAKDRGIKQQPSVYEGLTADSSFEDFQAYLFREGHGNCPEPCAAGQRKAAVGRAPACHTAVAGDECFAHVVKAAARSLERDASRYAGLAAGTLFERLQARLHRKGFGSCPRPCATSGVAAFVKRRFELFGQPVLAGVGWARSPLVTLSSAAALATVAFSLLFVVARRFHGRRGWEHLPLAATPARRSER